MTTPRARKDASTPGIDVPGLIRQASSRVGLDQLARQGKKDIAILSPERMAELIRRVARSILDKHREESGGRSRVPAGRIESESRAEFVEILRQHQAADRAKSDVEESRQRLDAELAGLRQELERRKGAERNAKTLDAGFQALADELDRQVVLVFERRQLILGQSESREEAAELRAVEALLQAVIGRIVAAERERFEAWGGRSREVAQLNRRIEKLQEHIATMESSFKSLADSKTHSTQEVRNVLRRLGLADEDKNLEKKREMLKVVLDANRDLKVRAAELDRRGITLAAPGRSAPRKAAL